MPSQSTAFPRPELLAPAGTFRAAITAFEHGADAIYCGLPKFNARERGENLTFEEIAKLIAYAKPRGKRVHIALNTLIKPNELQDVIETLGHLAKLNPDAIIVQDIGILGIIKNAFPFLEVHASTQMGFHNSLGAKFLQQFNVKRLILERQTTFEEIAEIKAHTQMPLEVFVHGALCCCRSGSCLFSSWLGGWSGNRGKCKQPCRRRYFSQNGNGFFFSPGDLCLIEHLPELTKLGIASFKIEGRLRGNDYVASVVTAYKLVLDAIYSPEATNKDIQAAIKEGKRILSQSLGRKWSDGFINRYAMEQVIQYKQIGGSGRPCGQVCRVNDKGFTVELRGAIAIGDRIRVQPQTGVEGPSLIVNKLIVNKKSVPKAFANETVFIPYPQAVPLNGTVFQVAKAEPPISYVPQEHTTIEAILPFQLAFSRQGVTATSPLLKEVNIQLPCAIEPAQQHRIRPEAVITEWHKGNNLSQRIGTIEITETEPLFLPNSTLRTLRKQFYEHLQTLDLTQHIQQTIDEMMQQAKVFCGQSLPPPQIMPKKTLLTSEIPRKKNSTTWYCADIKQWTPLYDEVRLPPFCPELQLNDLKQQIKHIRQQGCNAFRLTSLWQIELFKANERQHLIIGFPIPICNQAALHTLADLGILRQQLWVELDKTSLQTLAEFAPANCELQTIARLPLLETRAAISLDGQFRDSYGEQFFMKEEQGLQRLYPKTLFKLPENFGLSVFEDFSHIDKNEWQTDSINDFNFSHDFM